MNREQMNRSNPFQRADASSSTPDPSSAEASRAALESYTCLAGGSEAIQNVRSQLRRVSAHFRVALITGEAGTGKEVVAQALHAMSTKPDEQFVARSAASFLARVPHVLAQILQGSASAPMAAFDGLFQGTIPGFSEQITGDETLCANAPARCTLYLGDVNALTRGEQMYLVETLRRLTASRLPLERPRLIFSSERDLRTLTVAGQFDAGLYRKISALEIQLPPLRSRPEDIPVIAGRILGAHGASGGPGGSVGQGGEREQFLSASPMDSALVGAALAGVTLDDTIVGGFEKRAISRLQQYPWPGNVRELERVIELARLHAGGGLIEAMHLPSLGAVLHPPQPAVASGTPVPLSDKLEDIVQSHVLEVLMRCSGNKVRAAERLGISRSTLYRMLEHGNGSLALERLSHAS